MTRKSGPDRIKVPFVRQTLKNSCAVAALAMLLKFYGERFGGRPDRELIRKFKIKQPIYHEQLIWFTVRKNYKVILYTRFKYYKGKTKAKLIKNIRKAIKYWKPSWLDIKYLGTVPKNEVWGLPLIKAVQSGKCKISSKPTIYVLKKYIDKQIPVMVVLDWNIAYNTKGKPVAHEVVVNGYDKKNFYILDPIKGRKAISKKNFIKAWSTSFILRYMIVLRKKNG